MVPQKTFKLTGLSLEQQKKQINSEKKIKTTIKERRRIKNAKEKGKRRGKRINKMKYTELKQPKAIILKNQKKLQVKEEEYGWEKNIATQN